MKNIKYLIHNNEVKNLLKLNESTVSIIYEDYHNNFIPSLKDYIYNNLEMFIDENNTFFNIKKFTIDKSLIFFQESIVSAVSEIILSDFIWDKIIKPFFYLFWDKKEIPSSELIVDYDPHSTVSNFNIFSKLSLLATTFYASDLLSSKYNDISDISKLKDDIDDSFNRLISLGISDAHKYKELNSNKYNEQILKCKDTIKTFETFKINISCSLEAYLTYCASMIISLASIYIIKTNSLNINNMRSLLAVKDEFLINRMLTNIYNRFCFALDFIYVENKSIIIKWKKFIDDEVSNLSSKLTPTIKPKVIEFRPHHDNRPNNKPNFRQYPIKT